MKQQLSELSALLDGELEPHEAKPLFRAIGADASLREAWRTYALIGDQMRGEYAGNPDLTAGVMARLADEPVVLAPRNLPRAGRSHPLLALAASVAGVAVVGWLALSDGTRSPAAESGLLAVAPAPSLALRQVAANDAPVARLAAPAREEMSEYLLAHQTQAAAFRLGDSADNIRTVSLTRRAAQP